MKVPWHLVLICSFPISQYSLFSTKSWQRSTSQSYVEKQTSKNYVQDECCGKSSIKFIKPSRHVPLMTGSSTFSTQMSDKKYGPDQDTRPMKPNTSLGSLVDFVSSSAKGCRAKKSFRACWPSNELRRFRS